MGLVADTMRSKSKQALLLWVDGVREACCLHRLIIYSLSIFVLKSVIIPALEWILPGHCPQTNSPESCSFSSILELYQFLRGGLVQLFNAFWFYPLYIFSLILSNIWYNDIAKHGFFALENYGARDTKLSDQKESQILQSTVHREKSTDLEGFMISIAEQLYSVLLLTFFFVEVYVTGLVPYIGKALNFMLLSWMYAYYCFEYKWNLSGLSLDKRLDFFESNWAFFAGFGNPCVLAIFLFSPLVSYGVMAILFPLFVLTATGSEADKIVALPRRKWRGAGLGRLPIFFIADYMSHSQIDSWSCANFSSQDVCQHLNVRHLINWENLTFSPANVKTRDSFKEDEDNPEDASLETLFAEITSPNEREQGSMK